MSDFGTMTNPRARKQHRCEWCYGPIPKGEVHRHYSGMWDGNWQDWRMHNECEKACTSEEGYLYDGFMPGEGEMPERVKALLEQTT